MVKLITQASPLETLDKLEDAVLNHVFEIAPRYAVFLGLHEYDGLLPDMSLSHLRSWVEKAEELKGGIGRIQTGSIDSRRKLDLVCMELLLEDGLFEITELESHATRPVGYTFQLGVTPYISKEYAPVEERIKAVNRHLARIPLFLGEAEENLNQTLAEPFVKVSSMMCQGTMTELKGDASMEAAKSSYSTRTEFEKLLGVAEEAINNFLTALKEKHTTNMDFALGRTKFQKLLWASDRISRSVEDVLSLGTNDLATNLGMLDETVKKMGAASLEEAFDRVRKNHPSAESLILDTASTLVGLESFIREKDIVSIPLDIKCKVVPTPPPLRAWASAAMNFPGPFEKANVEGHYYVTPTETDWDDKKKEEWLRYLNYSSLKNVSAHEVYPGHFVHGLHVKAFAKTKTAKTYFNYGFTEGWAHYTEEMMLEEGYGNGDPSLRLVQLEDALLRDCRYIVSFKMHTQGMSLEDAKKFIMENAKLEEHPAEREAIRGTFDHGYYSYTLGKLFMKKARQRYFGAYPNATLRTFHDKVLSLGSAPAGMLENLVLS
jgi:uncharacterized protein (DUF885 family)